MKTIVIRRRFTPWKFYRVGHYKVYLIEQKDMMFCDITKQVAEQCNFRFDDNHREIVIKQWWLDWRRDIEQRLRWSIFDKDSKSFYFVID